MKSNAIHIAFGFHVNCYHSYRGDTNDAQGFGSDIRIIRKIIAALDALNADGIPVKGTWDSENFFSLEQVLPKHAPDILEGMKRRVRENGDENIIMGYSNGALGAMQEDELAASVNLALTNPQGSGLLDLFGRCEKIVRPQEVMFTPSQVFTYKKLGVRAVCLYYSCVPFDAFKTLIPPLDDEQAFNPLAFRYKDEELTVIPTYSNADVCDAGCLRAWVKALRGKQINEEINRDLFLFINMDADAIFWESLDLPLIGNRIANTDGIRGLVKEVSDLEYVVFDTPGGYLDTHESVGTVRFTQDTADGNFTGYASWAEKPYNRKIWTAIERSRTAAKASRNESDFLNRVKLLSTTHFGLAAPVLNVQREAAADSLAEKLTNEYLHTEGKLILHNVTGSALQCVQLSCIGAPQIRADGLEGYTAVPMGDGTVFVMLRFREIRERYEIRACETQWNAPGASRTLESGDARLVFSKDNRIERFTYRGRTIGEDDFLQSYLTYGGKKYLFKPESLTPGEIIGGSCLVLKGSVCLPGAERQGSFCYRFFTSETADGIFAAIEVSYPYTAEHDAISTENSTLGRYTDMQWQEAAPFELSFRFRKSACVIKRNYEGDVSSFRTASYGEADGQNKTLDAFNNQLTAGLVGVTDGEAGLLVGCARNVLNSMAFCPMRLRENGSVTMNPFGTYFGKQRHHPNRSNDRIPLTYSLIAPQSKSLAPAYNGSRERAVLCLMPFEGSMPQESALDALTVFADGAYPTGSDGCLSPFAGDNVRVHRAENMTGNPKIRSPLLSGIKGNVGKYIRYGTRAIAYIVRSQIRSR